LRGMDILSPNFPCPRISQCVPLGDDYKALDDLIRTPDRTATHFTGVEDFYGGRAPWHSTP